jgi:hypothetical protein
VTRTVPGLLAFALLSLSCAGARVIPDPRVPHRIAEEAEVRVWCRTAEGDLAKCRVRALEGWWLASPQVVEP